MSGSSHAGATRSIEPIEFDYYGFLTTSYLIRSRSKKVLVDTGSASAARDHILPKLSKEGSKSLVAIVDTHSHVDHSGGTALLSRNTRLPAMVHRLEARWIIDRRLAFGDLFKSHRRDVPVTGFMENEFLADAGEGFQDLKLVEGGESLGVPSIRLIHTPGHSPGSLSVFAEEERCLFTGDSIQGTGTAPFESTIPLYDDFSAYRDSLVKVSKMSVDNLMTSHPLKPLGKTKFVGDEVKELISVSLKAVDLLHSEVATIVRDHERGTTTLEVAQEVAKAHGSSWLQPVDVFFVRTVAAHLNKLEEERAVERHRTVYFAKS